MPPDSYGTPREEPVFTVGVPLFDTGPWCAPRPGWWSNIPNAGPNGRAPLDVEGVELVPDDRRLPA